MKPFLNTTHEILVINDNNKPTSAVINTGDRDLLQSAGVWVRELGERSVNLKCGGAYQFTIGYVSIYKGVIEEEEGALFGFSSTDLG